MKKQINALISILFISVLSSNVFADFIKKPIRTFEGHTYSVWSVAFSPDGRYALPGSDDDTLKLWDVNSGVEIRFFIDEILSSIPVPPTAAFSISTKHGEAPLTVTLDASSSTDPDGTIVEYNWSASDGQTASSKRVNMTFSNVGTYTITLVVKDDSGVSDTVLKTVTVTAKPVIPVAHLTVSPTNGEAPLTVSLNGSGSTDADGTIVEYAWTTSDGQQAFGANTQMTFNHAGTYSITLTVTDNDGVTDTAKDGVTVTAKPVAPVAHLGISPKNGEAPLTVSLNGSGSTDADGTIVEYAWKASNGQQAFGTNTEITFSHSGTYDITLTVTDNGGMTATVQDSVTVTAKPVAPVAHLSISPTNGEAPLTVSLNGSGSTDADGTIVEYAWKASNGQQAFGTNTEITFSHSGTYDITLTVTDNGGLTDTAQGNVTVTPPSPNVPPTAAFSIYPTEGVAPLTITLDASGSTDSDGMIAEYNWIATDGQERYTNKKLVNMTFSNVGTYIISFMVTDDKGAESTVVQQTVTVTATDNDGLTDTAQDSVTVEESDTESDIAYLEFIGLNDFYQVGETVVMELVETANRDKYTRVDLWVAIQLPSEEFLFRTDIPLNPWSSQPQAHKTSIENAESSHHIFDFKVPEGLGGDYTLYAAYVKEGENPVTNGFSIRSNVVVQQIFLANRTSTEKPDMESDVTHLEFKGLKDFYKVGETVVMELVEMLNSDKYTRVDLWVAVQLPSEEFLFRTDIPLNPWSSQPQAHKTSIENAESSHHIFDFEVPEGLGGDYTLYAVYVKEGKNPVTNEFSHCSNLVIRQIFLANRKD